ncbi:CRISPR-associated helicase/endonuclease Cas3 [Paenibacillus physcomitrellae]|uniref:CRISPR-associated helicase/endonuclease Cas3 n=1 Tax=Paenibacillus physcomitrellae TaxID=1619311 RepID=A0ABQ1G019_9BACL|nr:CRISPR-associated helicase/endonuclease Cas3 [Paenibacillus physcomitrellae]GGA34750.1 CRISPR-associated helicase/endonuclease Cas3 [Paenibacillus physcomitrellae]
MKFIAHIRESDGENQLLKAHLLEVKALAESYGAKIGVAHISGLAGLLHDMGKFTKAFVDYLIEAVAHPEAPPKRGSIDHSTAGGRLLYNEFHTGRIDRERGILAEVVGNAIISHHSYLHDYLNPDLESPYLRRVRDKEDIIDYDRSVALFFEQVMNKEEFQAYVDKAVLELRRFLSIPSSFSPEAKYMFLTKFVFSSLIDGDRTNTRRFEDQVSAEEESNPPAKELFQSYYDKLMAEVQTLASRPGSNSSINRLRSEMSEQCDKFADKSSGIYTLSIPTGGGKTLASLRYALKHAANNGKKHIIYVLPYTTIIEQNAAEVRRILQDEVHILEHHSNVAEEIDKDDELEDGFVNTSQKLKLAKDNWDSPVIFTTMVQFLNVFFAKGSRNIRRLHNLSEAVIIFDEVQKVPVSCVSLFNEALNFLKDYGHSSIVLCTATQPALDFVEHELHINPDAEMIQNLDQVIAEFKRVEIRDETLNGTYTNQELTDFIRNKLDEKRNLLIILNTKMVVKDLYQRLLIELPDMPVYHLSTSMCAAHRKQILNQIRVHLKNKEKIVCISTPLIEAGVDVSFECVIRSLAGLDSIAQAAGRCNRHGEDALQQVYVIDHAEENLKHLDEIRIGKDITKRMLVDLQRDADSHGGHLLSVQAMTFYFQKFYTDVQAQLNFPVSKLDVDMTELLFAGYPQNNYFQNYCLNYQKRPPLFLVNSYRTAAEHFQVIEDLTTSVIVPYEEGNEIIAELNGAERIEDFGRLMRKAQQYTINLYPHELQALDRSGGLERCFDGQILVLKDGAYNEEYGLDLENESWAGLQMF